MTRITGAVTPRKVNEAVAAARGRTASEVPADPVGDGEGANVQAILAGLETRIAALEAAG